MLIVVHILWVLKGLIRGICWKIKDKGSSAFQMIRNDTYKRVFVYVCTNVLLFYFLPPHNLETSVLHFIFFHFLFLFHWKTLTVFLLYLFYLNKKCGSFFQSWTLLKLKKFRLLHTVYITCCLSFYLLRALATLLGTSFWEMNVSHNSILHIYDVSRPFPHIPKVHYGHCSNVNFLSCWRT